MVLNDQSRGLDVARKVSEIIVDAEGSRRDAETRIVSEHFIDLIINEQLAAKLVCTPSNLPEMIIGRMKTEGYIQSIDEVDTLYICEYGSKAKVFLKDGTALVKTIENEPTCCTGNQVFLSNIHGTPLQKLEPAKWKEEWIFQLANVFAGESKIHKSTQGTHCCYLSIGGEVLYFAEDIGRHNALDKAIGYAVINKLKLSECILFVTGRIATDMVKKVVAAGIPVLVTKAVPTDQAVKMAKDYQLTLICKAWPDRFEIFSQESDWL